MKWEEFVEKVKGWANARNLIKGSTAQAQALKGLSEAGELADNVAKGNLDKIKDDIGDNCVVAVIVNSIIGADSPQPDITHPSMLGDKYDIMSDIASDWAYYLDGHDDAGTDIPFYCQALAIHLRIDFEECLEQAWNDIKDRVGIMHNGVFVKSSDSRYEEICKLYATQ
jgi:NTP pyrophosphatase (non-canonical NTP hydrolase)